MYGEADTWALVLAAGDGTRLRSLTTAPSGSTIPKQYCSLHHGPSLLHEALGRANAFTSPARTCTVVAEHHRQWWQPALAQLPRPNVIVQPANRGTANGILLPLLHIVERDPDAKLVLLPADHHVRREGILAGSLRKAAGQLDWRADEMLLLGLQPEEADPELGYIVPQDSDGRGALRVARFVEKPSAAQAQELLDRGALWNAFIIAATAQALLGQFRRRMPEVFAAMRAAVRHDLYGEAGGSAIAQLYARLPTIDFSRDLLPGAEADLRVLPVPRCGWSDLGTPKRVAEAIARVPAPSVAADAGMEFAPWSLAAQRPPVHAFS
jgi:mannose-1-phosphate guanylyltransferase